ncbi:MAG TPA: sugar phosphate isomerase/epimerase [Planctomycetota bacterium]|nr:sugar phosphate isomerase/epimerase [Planctomycetota bacterium]HRR80833.1 sugar phosphate isomerase/epimerase [Planctomycetota bacterium]HRT95988.1 sugar phosphate isomerase/epimerase [Planctomycetota bacterium]
MALPLGLQLYSLREAAAKDFPGVLAKVADMGYAGVEYAGLHNMKAADVAKIVADLGLIAVSAHMPCPDKNNLNQVVDDAKALGIGYIVTGGWIDQFKDAEAIKAFAAKVEAGAELVAPYGLKVGIHNHWCEFDHLVEGKLPHALFMSLTKKAFAQLDIYWTKFGGTDPEKYLPMLKGRVPLLHVKDGTLEKDKDGRPCTPHTAVGAGKVNIPAAVKAAEKAGTKWLLVELDNCATDMEAAVRQSAEYLINEGLAEGAGCCDDDCCCS